jgi:hypothetical protein
VNSQGLRSIPSVAATPRTRVMPPSPGLSASPGPTIASPGCRQQPLDGCGVTGMDRGDRLDSKRIVGRQTAHDSSAVH